MIVPFNLKKHYEIIERGSIPISELFRIPSMPTTEKYARKYLAPIIGIMPTGGRMLLTDIIKSCRNPSKKLVLNYPLSFTECQIIAEKINGRLKPWWGKQAVVCIAHDVDNIIGYRAIQEIAGIEYENGLRTSFNFLTHDNYRVDEDLIDSLLERNFEIGLHGYNHDQGFAFRGMKVIAERIDQAIEVLQVDGIGYRSPALSLSENLFKVLGERDFIFDSSLQIASPFYHSVRIPYPYYMEDYGIWELPLMVQDDNYFRDSNSTEKVIFDSIRRFINEAVVLNGICVINMHPHLMANRIKFYKKFIHVLKEFDNVAFASTKEVINYIQRDTDNS